MAKLRNMTCKEIMRDHFNSGCGMVNVYILKNYHLPLKGFALSTIRNNLSVLKQEGYLCIGFRTKGKWEKYTKIDNKRIGSGKFFPGKCYYKLNK